MEPVFEDSTTLKFVNGKFVLATNDPKNPVQLIRQVNKNDTSNVIIYLTNGISYEDSIESIEDLIDISGNKAFEVILDFEISVAVYDHASRETIERLFSKFLRFNCEFEQDYYLQTNKMIPQRIKHLSMESELVFYERDGDFRAGPSKISFSYLVISPPQHISSIVSGKNGMEESIVSWLRSQINDVSGIGVSGRNAMCSEINKANLAETVKEMKISNEAEYSLSVSNKSNNSEAYSAGIESIDKIVSFFRP